MDDNETTDTADERAGRKGDALAQLASVAVHGSSVRSKPGTDPDELSES